MNTGQGGLSRHLLHPPLDSSLFFSFSSRLLLLLLLLLPKDSSVAIQGFCVGFTASIFVWIVECEGLKQSMEIYAGKLGKVQQLTAISTLENRAEMSERRWFRPGYHVEGSDEEVICPKPRRVAHMLYPCPDVLKIPRRPRSHPVTRADADPGFEILDIFLSKGGLGESPISACSPPYFCGSPPSRSSNPLIHDVQFIHQRFTPSPSVLSQPNSCESSRGGKPLVRVEGFAFAGSDSRCSVSARA